MKTFWENNGDPLIEGEHANEYAATIDLEDGTAVSRYYGKSHKEVADKLLQAQGNAAEKIAQQKRELQSQKKPEMAKPSTEFQRRPLSAKERLDVAQGATNPETAPEAIRTVVESELGAPLEKVAEVLQREERARINEEIASEAKAFAESTPDYWPGPNDHNVRLILNYLITNKWAYVRDNFALAWEELKDAGLIVFKPATQATTEGAPTPGAEHGQAAERTAPATTVRQRGTIMSSGVRASDAPGGSYRGGEAKKYTRQQIEAMPSTEYDEKLKNEPGFRQLVDTMMGAPAAR